MNHGRFPSSLFPLPIILVLQVMLGIPQSLGSPEMFEKCRHAGFKCGKISAGYPFSGHGIPWGCGHPRLQLHCDENNITTIEIVDVRYKVLEIHRDRQTLKIARLDVIENDLCKPKFQNSILDNKLLDLVNAPDYDYATVLYGCKDLFSRHYEYCSLNKSVNKDVWIRFPEEVIASGQCSANFTVPILKSFLGVIFDFSWFLKLLQKGFEVEWKLDRQVCQKCNETGGACGFNLAYKTICHCPNESFTWREMTGCFPLTAAAGPKSGGNGTQLQADDCV